MMLKPLPPGTPYEGYLRALKNLPEPRKIPDFLRANLTAMADAGAFFTVNNPTGAFTPCKVFFGTLADEDRIFYSDFTLGPAWSGRMSFNCRPEDLPAFIAFLARLGIYPDTGVRVTQDAQHKNGMVRITMGVYLPHRDWNTMATRLMLLRGHAKTSSSGLR